MTLAQGELFLHTSQEEWHCGYDGSANAFLRRQRANAQTGTTYTYLTGDFGKLVTHSNAAAIAGTLPQANSTTFQAGWWMDVENRGAGGTLTITPTTSTIDGAATLVLRTNQGVRIVSDGTNYFTVRGMASGGVDVNAQTGTTYTVLTTDRGKLVTHTNASAIAVTLPQATTNFGANFHFWVQNRGAGTVTITPTTSTIDGAATLALTTNQGALIVSDGTNWYTMRGVGSASGGGTGNGGMFRVRVATTANGTLATAFDNGSTVDGVTIATGDYLLLKNQTTATENGVYVAVASGAPTRVADFETADTVHGYVISVVEGTTNADSVWLCTNNTGSDVVGTDDLTFARLGSGGPGLLNVQVFTSSDTYTKTGGCTRAVVEVQGPGGGGGGVDGQGASTAGAAGGGGAGGYARKLISDMSAITTATITVGTGGAGGTAGANNGSAGSGASSYADGTTTVTGNAGAGGIASTADAGVTSANGGAGGTATGGDLNITGAAGDDGEAYVSSLTGANGGDSMYGTGGKYQSIGVTGGAGSGYGSGGAGAGILAVTTNVAGGAGAAGLVIVWEYGFETTAFDASINTLTEVDIARDDYIAIGDTSDSGNNKKAAVNRTLAQGAHVVEGRLTLTTAVPVTTADVTGAGTLYFALYNGNRVRVYDGTRWIVKTFSELSLALTITSGKNYDVFLDDDASTLSVVEWTNDTTRATAIVLQDGVYVKSGDTTKLYLGTIRASGTNTTEDSNDARFVWNMYNRVKRQFLVIDTAAGYTYTSSTWRQRNATAGYKVEVVIGITEEPVEVRHSHSVWSSAATGNPVIGIGINKTNGNDASFCAYGPSTTHQHMVFARVTHSSAGYAYFAAVERAYTNSTDCDFIGYDAGLIQTGLEGEVWA